MQKVAFLSVLAVAAVAGAAPEKPAAVAAMASVNGYVCMANMYPLENGWGEHGGAEIIVKTEPFCGGAFVGHAHILTTGHPATCAGDNITAGTYTGAQLSSMFEKAVDAAERGQRVRLYHNSCHDLVTMTFYGK